MYFFYKMFRAFFYEMGVFHLFCQHKFCSVLGMTIQTPQPSIKFHSCISDWTAWSNLLWQPPEQSVVSVERSFWFLTAWDAKCVMPREVGREQVFKRKPFWSAVGGGGKLFRVTCSEWLKKGFSSDGPGTSGGPWLGSNACGPWLCIQ